jgi:stage II sporulation protein D
MLFQTEPIVRVGILSDNRINFELYGDFKIQGFKNKFSGRFSAELRGNRIVCKSGKDKIEISNEIIFDPGDLSVDSFLIKDVPIGKEFHWERKETQRFAGSLKLLRSDNAIWVINVLPVTQYFKSVITSEMSAKSSLQLLKTHAVISRSWLFAQMERSESSKEKEDDNKNSYKTDNEIIRWQGKEEHELFDVCADDHCQRYQGITKILTENSHIAVEQTRGVVLMYDKKICDARYSKCCGGITESFENVWEPVKHKYLASEIDYKFEPENYSLDFSSEENARKWILSNPASFCNIEDDKILSQVLVDYDQETKDFFRWKIEYSQSQVAELIKTKSGIDFGNIIDLVPVERGESARLVKLKIVGTNKEIIVGKELEIRRLLSKTHLYSSAFIVDKEGIKNSIPQKFIIHGAGWGHGVGLCQIGAAVMAAQGYQFDEILLHYFKNAKLKKVY